MALIDRSLIYVCKADATSVYFPLIVQDCRKGRPSLTLRRRMCEDERPALQVTRLRLPRQFAYYVFRGGIAVVREEEIKRELEHNNVWKSKLEGLASRASVRDACLH